MKNSWKSFWEYINRYIENGSKFLDSPLRNIGFGSNGIYVHDDSDVLTSGFLYVLLWTLLEEDNKHLFILILNMYKDNPYRIRTCMLEFVVNDNEKGGAWDCTECFVVWFS